MLTTTEAAVLSLLAIEGEHSGYELTKLCEQAIGHVWSPARSGLYAVLPRLVKDGLATSRPGGGRERTLYRITAAGREAVDDWLQTVEPGATHEFWLKLFVGGLAGSHDVLVEHVEQYRADVEERLAVLSAIDNTRRGHDFYHSFSLRWALGEHERLLDWCDWVIAELRRTPRSRVMRGAHTAGARR
jgi:DNA-binding PadR family transcriptional regulator